MWTGLMRMVLVIVALSLSACLPRAVPNDPIVSSVRNNDVEAFDAFVAKGGDVNLTDREGNPLIYLAAGPQGGTEIMARLIEAGADINATGASGRTPLENAVGWCDVEMVQLLLFAGADFTSLGNGKAKETACKAPADRRAIVILLIERAIAEKEDSQ